MLETNKTYLGDCLEIMEDIDDKSIDMILCDLPYGTTQNKWDCIIPLNDFIIDKKGKYSNKNDFDLFCYKNKISFGEGEEIWNNTHKKGLWSSYNRIIKEKGVILLNGQFAFSSQLIESNLKDYKYSWVWKKGNKPTGFLNAKKQPLRIHEDILVFYKNQCTYNPQMVKGQKCHSRGKSVGSSDNRSENYGQYLDAETVGDLKYPQTIVNVGRDNDKYHRTQKPVALNEYFIRTYTNENDLVLDNCFGSASTLLACQNTNRRFIGIEKDSEMFTVGSERLENNINI